MLALIICLIVQLGAISFAREQMPASDKKLRDIEVQLEKTEAELEQAKDDLSDTQVSIEEVVLQKLALEYTIEQNERQILTQEAYIEKAQRDIEQAKAEVASYLEEFGERLRAIYLQPQEDRKLAFLLTSKSVDDFFDRWDFVQTVVDEDKRMVQILKEKQARVVMLENEQQIRLEELVHMKHLLDADRQYMLVVEEVLREREEELNKYLERLKKERLELAQSSQKIRDSIDQMTVNALGIAAENLTISSSDYMLTGSLIAARQSLVALPIGEWVWPTPNTKIITSPFGSRTDPISGNPAFHEGIDIAGPVGTPILAVTSGIVTHAGWFSNGYGYAVIIAHGDGYTSVYAHGSKVMTEVGQIVEPGELILLMGSTGYSTGSHVHFELIHHGQLIDPLSMVSPDQSN